jgi:hypothetical protein
MAAGMTGNGTTWRNRITETAEVDPATLVPNPKNWRTHPRAQLDALAGVLGEVGWVADVLVNSTTGHVVDGHARVELALAAWCFERYAPTGCQVLDPFAGAGWSLLAAEQTGRAGRGVEYEADYVAVTLERLSRMGLEPRPEA